MKTSNQTPELPIVIPSFFFVNISVDAVGVSVPSKMLKLIDIIAKQNGLNLRIPRQDNIATKILDKSVIMN